MMEPPVLVVFAVSQTCGILAFVLVWMASFKDYDAAEKYMPQTLKNFSFHPALMSTALVFLFGCAAVTFRVLRIFDKPQAKLVHVGIHTLALILALTGSTFAFQATSSYGSQHFQTVHGLFGVITVALFSCQWLVSLLVFLWPKAPGNIRAPGIKIHVCLGVGVFLSAAITAFSGFGRISGSSTTTNNYYKYSAFFYLLYTLSIVFMLTLKKYKRPPDF